MPFEAILIELASAILKSFHAIRLLLFIFLISAKPHPVDDFYVWFNSEFFKFCFAILSTLPFNFQAKH